MMTDLPIWSYLAQFYLELEMIQKRSRENSDTLWSITFFFTKILSFIWDNVETAQVHCMLDT